VWVVQLGVPVEITYGEFLRTYYSDETTSPEGVEPRKFIRREDLEEGDEQTKWEIREWLPNGRTRFVRDFNNEADAENHLLEIWEGDYLEHGGDWDHYPTANDALLGFNKFSITDRATGTFIEGYKSEEAAREGLAQMEEEDREEGIFEEDFYELREGLETIE
jgi:hypothetical protein